MQDDTLKWSVAAAIRNHLELRSAAAVTLNEIQEMLAAWPAQPLPVQLVKEALELLEEMEVVSKLNGQKELMWKSNRGGKWL